MTDSTYNGWTNYETWNVKLWIDNEQSTYYDVTGHATEVYEQATEEETEPDKYEFADWLKSYVEGQHAARGHLGPGVRPAQRCNERGQLVRDRRSVPG